MSLLSIAFAAELCSFRKFGEVDAFVVRREETVTKSKAGRSVWLLPAAAVAIALFSRKMKQAVIKFLAARMLATEHFAE